MRSSSCRRARPHRLVVLHCRCRRNHRALLLSEGSSLHRPAGVAMQLHRGDQLPKALADQPCRFRNRIKTSPSSAAVAMPVGGYPRGNAHASDALTGTNAVSLKKGGKAPCGLEHSLLHERDRVAALPQGQSARAFCLCAPHACTSAATIASLNAGMSSGVREVIKVHPLAPHCLTSTSTQPAAPAFSRSSLTLG